MKLSENPMVVHDAVDFFHKKFGQHAPRIGVITGSSGPKSLGEHFDVGYRESALDHRFSLPSLDGHSKKVRVGKIKGVPTIWVPGRVHYNENNSMFLTTMMVRVLALWGVKKLILTNLSGTLDPSKFEVGEVCIVCAHHLEGVPDPISGDPDLFGSYGERHLSMKGAYSRDLRAVARYIHNRGSGAKGGYPKKDYPKLSEMEAIYVMKEGPTFEPWPTGLDLKNRGFDLAGMSTAPEAVVARQHGLQTLALSLVSNIVPTKPEDEEADDAVAVTHEGNTTIATESDVKLGNYLADIIIEIGKRGRDADPFQLVELMTDNEDDQVVE